MNLTVHVRSGTAGSVDNHPFDKTSAYQNAQLGDHHLPMIPTATASAPLAKNHLQTGSHAPDATSLPPTITARTPAAKRMPEIWRLTIRVLTVFRWTVASAQLPRRFSPAGGGGVPSNAPGFPLLAGRKGLLYTQVR